MILISIIVPSYNHQSFLEKRLNSIFNQTFKDYEVILLDDCSTDSSWDILCKYKNHPKVSHCLRNELNSGSTFKQWKKGLELAKGDWIWIAESDDYCENDFLKILFDKVSRDNKIGLIYSQTFDIDEYDNVIYDRNNYTSNFKPNIWFDDFSMNGLVFIKNYLSIKNVIPNTSAVLFKKPKKLEKVFNEELLKMKMCGDWLFWIRILSNSNLVFVNKYLNYFRDHSSVTRNHINKEKFKLRLIEESVIRKILIVEFKLYSSTDTSILYSKWFSIYKNNIIHILNNKFYAINLEKNRIKFALKYIKYLF